jgi:FkbM family methyltransferase
MTRSAGESFRAKGLAERIAEALPSGGALGRLRRQLKPAFDRILGQAGTFRSVLPNGETVLVDPAHRHITWNAAEYSAFRAVVRPGHVVLEAGANVGAYTVLFAQWAGPAGRVIAFEPDPGAFAGLRRHVEINRLADRVDVQASAVSDGIEPCLPLALGESSGVSRIAPDGTAPGTRIATVPAVSIDAFCAEHRIRPDVIKIDVEGAELAALRGARATIAAAGPPLHLFVEMHPQLWNDLGYSAEDLRKECAAQNLTAETLDGSLEEVWRTEGVCVRLRPART